MALAGIYWRRQEMELPFFDYCLMVGAAVDNFADSRVPVRTNQEQEL
jgi:hypothetical protein